VHVAGKLGWAKKTFKSIFPATRRQRVGIRNGATTLSIMTFCIIMLIIMSFSITIKNSNSTLSIMTLSIMTLSIITLRITTLSIMAFCIITLIIMTFSIEI
jgi:hypothetical protein